MIHPFDHLDEVRWGAVAFLTVLSFVLGALWHSPLMFGSAWLKEVAPFKKPRGGQLALLFGAAALLHLTLVTALSALIGRGGAVHGLSVGLGVAFCFVVTTLGVTYLFAARSLRLFLIDAGFYVAFLALAGVALGY